MSGDYKETHNSILTTAKNIFLNRSYESVSLREICKVSGITTGGFYRHFKDKHDLYCAVVSPVVDGLAAIFSSNDSSEIEAVEKGNFESIWVSDERLIIEASEVIFAHYDEAKILLTNSRGTMFENFIESLAEQQAESAVRLLKKALTLNYKTTLIEKEEIKILATSQLLTLSKIFTSDLDKETTLAYAHDSNKFFSAGWKALFLK